MLLLQVPIIDLVLLLQVPIFDLLKKFDGQHTSDDIKAGRRRFRLTKLPSYLVLHIKRFTKNNFFVEKNPTIVNFPVKNLELRDIVPVPAGKPAGCVTRLLLHTIHICARAFSVVQNHNNNAVSWF